MSRRGGLDRQRDLSRFGEEVRRQGGGLPVGVDEAGRGPLAGPVVAAAVALPRGAVLYGLDDSKRLSPLQRERLYEGVRMVALGIGVGVVDAVEVDRRNIYRASLEAMRRAVAALPFAPGRLLVDGRPWPDCPWPQEALVGGDGLAAEIAAASVVAKVVRDRLMDLYHRLYPDYGLDRHKGYPTAEHRRILERVGPSPLHRRSFTGCREAQDAEVPPPVGKGGMDV